MVFTLKPAVIGHHKEWVIVGNTLDKDAMEREYGGNEHLYVKKRDIVGDHVIYVVRAEETILAYAMEESKVPYLMFMENAMITKGPGELDKYSMFASDKDGVSSSRTHKRLNVKESTINRHDSLYSLTLNVLYGDVEEEPAVYCRNSPSIKDRGYVNGYFSWGIDRLDQRRTLLDGESCLFNDGSNVDVYVLDTGIYKHETFDNRLTHGYSYYDDNNVHDTDCNGHGTHVAGLIASNVYGTAVNTNVISVKVLDCDGKGDYASIVAGLVWIRQQYNATKRSIINMSLGARGGYSEAIENLIDSMIKDDNIIVVASAGNYAESACDSFPGSIKDVITVASVDHNDKKSSFSNVGPCVDIFAPGSSLISCGIAHPKDSLILSGTSMSAPLTSGVVAMLLQKHPFYSMVDVKQRLIAMANENSIGNLNDGSPNVLLYAGLSPSDASPPRETNDAMQNGPHFGLYALHGLIGFYYLYLSL